MEPTDIITLRDAIEGPPVWGAIAACDPDRPIAVKMTYADLFAIARMIQKRGEENGRTCTD